VLQMVIRREDDDEHCGLITTVRVVIGRPEAIFPEYRRERFVKYEVDFTATVTLSSQRRGSPCHLYDWREVQLGPHGI
jgi:hypothetical protein